MKPVFVLGAGFSVEAGAPSQEKIITTIFNLHENAPDTFHDGAVKKFSDFLENLLNIPPEMHKHVPLEDIFTPIDRCLLDNVTLFLVDSSSISIAARTALIALIS